MADVLAAVWAGAVHMTHGHLEWNAKQLLPTTSEREFLIPQAAMWGITVLPATFASGTVTATGDNGAIVPEDSILVRDDGVTYRVTADSAPIAGGETEVAVEAVLAGADGNLAAGEVLAFESPISGVDASVTVGPGDIDGGVDEEDTEALRVRFLERLREPPQGGGDQDYVAWAKEVPGVTRVWVYRHENGLGTVVVRFVRDGESPIFPSAGEVTAVQVKLDAERPTTAEVTASAPTSLAVNFNVALTPNTVAVQDAVEAELTDLLFREGEPGDGGGRGTILLSHILVAIGVADGVEDFDLIAPVADVVPGVGELPQPGTFTWS